MGVRLRVRVVPSLRHSFRRITALGSFADLPAAGRFSQMGAKARAKSKQQRAKTKSLNTGYRMLDAA